MPEFLLECLGRCLDDFDWRIVAACSSHVLLPPPVSNLCRCLTCPPHRSGCRTAWYCGTACSHADWREGGHRRMCKLLSEERQRRKAAQQQQGAAAARAIAAN